MAEPNKTPLRVMFCIGVAQNFFDLRRDETLPVWEAFCKMINDLAALPGVKVWGTHDDDRTMVGPSPAYPWTTYILADVPDYDTVAAACNLLRVTPVGEYNLWRYMRIEARIGRPLAVPGVN